MALGFIKTYRGRAGQLITTDPKAYLLLSLIALRARREDDDSGVTNLKANQAFIGDYKKIGLTRDSYRGAVKRLVKQGFITVRPTRRGSIATLTSIAIHDINAQDPPIRPPSQCSMENGQLHPLEPQSNPTSPPLTKKEEYARRTTTTHNNLYPCMLPAELSDKDKHSLMKYPEDRVRLALEYAAVADIQTSLIQTLHWHCREPIPPPPPKESQSLREKLAKDYIQFLCAQGFTELAKKNEVAMKENYLFVICDGRDITVTLKGSLESLKDDLRRSREEIVRMTQSQQG